jgi:hypothetical protein
MANKDRPIYPETVVKIKNLYDELSMLPLQDTREARFVTTWAKKRGWLSPLAWDDEDIDNPYAIPVGISHVQAYNWFWQAATMTERIEWVLEHGLAATRKER